jgi:sugar phosphate isomerase/epimerase
MSLPIALQLYSVRGEFSEDLHGTLKAVKEMGYDGVELAGFGPHGAPAVKNALDMIGLKCVGAHVPFDTIMESPQRVFSEYKVLGCDYVAIPWMSMETAPGGELFHRTIPVFEQFAKVAQELGVTLLYHNHEFEFRKIGDKYGLDVLYDSISPELLQTQIDTCWVKMIGIDPAAYIRKYTGRAPLVHLKDFEQTGELDGAPYDLIGAMAKGERVNRGTFTFKAVGDGTQDVPAILQASLDAGAQWVIVEFDQSPERPPLETARKSREYLKSLGW